MGIKKLLLDTSAYSSTMRGNRVAKDALQIATRVLLPTVVIGELWSGFESGRLRDENYRILDEFLGQHRVSVVPIVRATAERYAHISAYLRTLGRPIPTNDVWIAAAAMEHGAELLTADAHFLQLPQVIVRYLE